MINQKKSDKGLSEWNIPERGSMSADVLRKDAWHDLAKSDQVHIVLMEWLKGVEKTDDFGK